MVRTWPEESQTSQAGVLSSLRNKSKLREHLHRTKAKIVWPYEFCGEVAK